MKWHKIADKEFPKDQQVVLAETDWSELGYSILKMHYQQGEPAFWFTDTLGCIDLDKVIQWQPIVELRP